MQATLFQMCGVYNRLTETEENCINGHVINIKENCSDNPSTNYTNLKQMYNIRRWKCK